jgi:hypothetical protein
MQTTDLVYACPRGHLGVGPGTCYRDGCYGHFKPVAPSAKTHHRLVKDELSTLNLVNWTDRAKQHFHPRGPENPIDA